MGEITIPDRAARRQAPRPGAAGDASFDFLGAPRPQSGAPPRMSQMLWQVDWRDHFPFSLSITPALNSEDAEVTVDVATFDECMAFAASHFAKIYGTGLGNIDNSRFLWIDTDARTRERKAAYYRLTGDFFAFRRPRRLGDRPGDDMIGIYSGTPHDWATYYLRNISLLPEYQGKKIFQRFIERFLSCLRAAGVERVEADVSPGTHANIHILTKLGFNVSGMTLSERWGALVRLQRLFNEENDAAFSRQFCLSAT